jgi:hypothetical protein
MRIGKLTLATLGCLLLWTVTAVAAPAQKEHALKVGKKGEITLTQKTKVGNVVLQPDTYVVQHRVSGGDHFVRFVELKQVEAEQSGTEGGHYTYTEHQKAGEIKCRVEPAGGLIQTTTVYTITEGGVLRITKVAIKGEDVLHVF